MTREYECGAGELMDHSEQLVRSVIESDYAYQLLATLGDIATSHHIIAAALHFGRWKLASAEDLDADGNGYSYGFYAHAPNYCELDWKLAPLVVVEGSIRIQGRRYVNDAGLECVDIDDPDAKPTICFVCRKRPAREAPDAVLCVWCHEQSVKDTAAIRLEMEP